MEEPNTGRYVSTTKDGTYLCAACKKPVFSSRDKVVDGSGYAAFRVISEDDTQVSFQRSYSMDGKEETRVVCTACGAHLGTVSSDTVRSANDLEQGNHEYVVHVASKAIVLKKYFTFKNYPFGYIFIGLFIVGVIFILPRASSFVDSIRYRGGENQVHLWIGDEDVYATTYSLDAINPEEQSLVLGTDAILITLSKKEEAPELRLSNQPVVVLWLDEIYTVVKVEEKGVGNNDTLVVPERAVFALVLHRDKLPATSLREGMKVLVVK